jgi:hypothetical protein
VVPRSLRLLRWVVHCVGYGLHHPDTTGERCPASPNLKCGASQRSGDLAPFRHPLATVLPDPADPIRVRMHGAELSMLKRMVQRAPCPAAAGIHLADGLPTSVCANCRVSRRKIFKSEDDVSWGFFASKQPYFGIHNHVVLRNEIVAFALTPANVAERLAV